MDELNDILERKLRNEKCLRIAAEESLMDLQGEHNALLVKLAEFEEEKIILKNLLDDLRPVFISKLFNLFGPGEEKL